MSYCRGKLGTDCTQTLSFILYVCESENAEHSAGSEPSDLLIDIKPSVTSRFDQTCRFKRLRKFQLED